MIGSARLYLTVSPHGAVGRVCPDAAMSPYVTCTHNSLAILDSVVFMVLTVLLFIRIQYSIRSGRSFE